MRNSTAFAGVVFILVSCASLMAQVPAPSPRSAVDRTRDRSEADLQRRMLDMRLLEQRLRLATRQARRMPAEPKLSDEERDRVLKLRRVAPSDVGKYSGLLRQEHTGIFKLFPDLGCISKKVIKLTRECERYVPLSSSFTFRTNGYSDEIYHDINFKDGVIASSSFFSQGIFAVLGDEPVESTGLSHPALKFLTTTFQADVDPKEAGDHARQFRNGLDADGFRYADSIEPRENITYAMRMIAYRLENGLAPLSDETTMNEMMFHSLGFDKRIDVIVVFRILRRDEFDGFTIVWKELARSDASKIKFRKNQALRDFRPAQK